MPIFSVWYKGKQPVFQIKVLKCIAIHGQLSKKKITELLSANYPDVSDAVKALCEYSLIVFSYSDFSSRRAQRYYKITARGLDALIKEDPTPTEFWRAIIWFCKIAKKDIDPKM